MESGCDMATPSAKRRSDHSYRMMCERYYVTKACVHGSQPRDAAEDPVPDSGAPHGPSPGASSLIRGSNTFLMSVSLMQKPPSQLVTGAQSIPFDT